MKLLKKDTIQASACDASALLSPVGVFHLAEDMVTEMMGRHRIDSTTSMREYGAKWFFIRNHIELYRPVRWMEEYAAECYFSGVSSAKLFIDTVFRIGDETAAASRLELCAVDMKTGKVRRTATVGVGDSIRIEPAAIEIGFTRERFEPEELLEERTVRSSDIDYCRHTNNIAYIRYLADLYSVSQMDQRLLRSVEVQYVNQTFEGDRLQIFRCGPDSFTIRSGGKTIVNCSCRFAEKE